MNNLALSTNLFTQFFGQPTVVVTDVTTAATVTAAEELATLYAVAEGGGDINSRLEAINEVVQILRDELAYAQHLRFVINSEALDALEEEYVFDFEFDEGIAW